jgi:hypothetical protein
MSALSVKRLIICVLSGLAAAGIVLFQQLRVLGRDDFRVVQHSTGAYKVFTYVFPFKVNDCNEILDGLVNPSPRQAPYRITGNVLFFFCLIVIGVRVGAWMWRLRRTTRRSEQAQSPLAPL